MICRIIIKFNQYQERNLTLHRKVNSHLKRNILGFLYNLINEGYRTFIIYIDTPADYWVAELLYFMIPEFSFEIYYKLGFWVYDEGILYDWLDNEEFFTEVISSAKKVIWRHASWFERRYIIKILNLR